MNCPLCGNSEISLVATRKNVPVLQNVLCNTEEKSTHIPRGDIELSLCHTCGFVFNAKYKQVHYSSDYENYQGCSSLFDDYLERNAERVVDFVQRQRKPVLLLEIGCGQGDFLQRIMNRIPHDTAVSAVGFDPAYEADRGTLRDSRCRVVPEYFNGQATAIVASQEEYPIKACISRHVIEHVSDPHMLLRECARLDGEVHLFLETPNVHWIMQHNAFEDIVYEHCSFYSPESMHCLIQKHGFVLAGFDNVFGGQYMWIEAEKEKNLVKKCTAYLTEEEKNIHKWRLWNNKRGGYSYGALVQRAWPF